MARRLADTVTAWAPWVAGALLAAPVLWFRYPPMGDLASHEALVSILRHLGDARYFPEGLYERNLGEPNQLFHAVAWLLSYAMPTDAACKVVVAATVLGTPVAAARLASHLGVTRWAALLIAPLALGWMFRWGLVANMAGFALGMAALPALDRLAREPTPGRALAAMLLTGLLYFAHESSMVIYAIASVVLAVQTPRRLRPLSLAACPGALAALLAAIYAVRSQALMAPSIRAVGPMTRPLRDKLTDLPGALFSAQSASLCLFAATLVALALFARESWKRRGAPGFAALTHRGPFGALAVILLGLYFAMPLSLGGSTLIHQRFLAPALAMAVLALAPPRGGGLGFAPLLAAFPLAMLAITLGGFVEADRSYRDLDVVLARMEDASAVAQLDLTPRDPSLVAPVVGAASRALAVHGGRLLFSFTDAPACPVSVPERYQWNEPVLRLAATPFAFMPAHDLLRFRYVLAYERVPSMEAAVAAALAPEARLVTKEGRWLLFESTLPLAKLTDPDAPLPSPSPENLADRVRRALGR